MVHTTGQILKRFFDKLYREFVKNELPNHGRRWSKHEIIYMEAMINGGHSIGSISKELKRTEGAIKAKAHKLGLCFYDKPRINRVGYNYDGIFKRLA